MAIPKEPEALGAALLGPAAGSGCGGSGVPAGAERRGSVRVLEGAVCPGMSRVSARWSARNGGAGAQRERSRPGPAAGPAPRTERTRAPPNRLQGLIRACFPPHRLPTECPQSGEIAPAEERARSARSCP